ncbi:MAG TPA: ATP-binding protein, partial [Firmicutes bacterium]|nr:ATP-binding protein [Bacillota bacterium]
MIRRFLEDAVFSDSMGRQMRFITGPRQSGKTTMAKEKLSAENCSEFYYNWDSQQVKRRYRSDGDFLAPELIKKKGRKVWVCFDEIHKMPKWKNIAKDFFDSHENKAVFIITGSARLDVFRKTGDSLAGRYFPFRLNPLMLAEISGSAARDVMDTGTAAGYIEKRIRNSKSASSLMEQIFRFSGFPEPCLKKDKVFASKWHDNYFERVIKEDIRELSSIHQLEKISDMISLIPARIGSPLSVNSLKEDLELNHATVKNYIKYLKLTYVLFEMEPYTKKINRPVKKEKKVYLYNIAVVKDEGPKFENYA